MCISLILVLLQEVPTGTSSSIEAAVSYNGDAVDAEVESEEEPGSGDSRRPQSQPHKCRQ